LARPGTPRRDVTPAIIDIAQDLLLAALDEDGVLDHLVFKGGTALRKSTDWGVERFRARDLFCSPSV
jgi:predicted nucleotidyltransferase component of viral defense system